MLINVALLLLLYLTKWVARCNDLTKHSLDKVITHSTAEEEVPHRALSPSTHRGGFFLYRRTLPWKRCRLPLISRSRPQPSQRSVVSPDMSKASLIALPYELKEMILQHVDDLNDRLAFRGTCLALMAHHDSQVERMRQMATKWVAELLFHWPLAIDPRVHENVRSALQVLETFHGDTLLMHRSPHFQLPDSIPAKRFIQLLHFTPQLVDLDLRGLSMPSAIFCKKDLWDALATLPLRNLSLAVRDRDRPSFVTTAIAQAFASTAKQLFPTSQNVAVLPMLRNLSLVIHGESTQNDVLRTILQQMERCRNVTTLMLDVHYERIPTFLHNADLLRRQRGIALADHLRKASRIKTLHLGTTLDTLSVLEAKRVLRGVAAMKQLEHLQFTGGLSRTSWYMLESMLGAREPRVQIAITH